MRYDFILLVLFLPNYNCESEYHWEEYNGTVPDCAVEAGYNSDGDILYIGQATSDDITTVVPIDPDIKEFPFPKDSTVVTAPPPIKILCAPGPEIYWLKVKGENLHVDTIKDIPVVGGNSSEGVMYVGRVNYRTGIKIGPVAAYNLNEAPMDFVNGDKVLQTTTYEVLMLDSGPKRRRRPHPRHPHRPQRPGRN